MKITRLNLKDFILAEVAALLEVAPTIKLDKRPSVVADTVKLPPDHHGGRTGSQRRQAKEALQAALLKQRTAPLPEMPSHMYADPIVRDSAFRKEMEDYIKSLPPGRVTTAGTQNLNRFDPENPNPTNDPDEVGLETMELTPEEFKELMKNESSRQKIMQIVNEELKNASSQPFGTGMEPVDSHSQDINDVIGHT